MSDVQYNLDLQAMNSLNVPSSAACFVDIASLADLQQARNFARAENLKILVLGDASNLILPDKVDALVARVRLKGKSIQRGDQKTVLLEVAAGENWHSLVDWSLQENLCGLQNLALIPGTVGAAPVQNIGAYGVEISDCLESLEYFDLQTGELISLTNAECGFAYRDSRFKNELRDRAVITRICLHLEQLDSNKELQTASASYPSLQNYLQQNQLAVTPQNIFQAVCAIRKSRLPDPAQEPNVGSFFHNPVLAESHYRALQKTHSQIPGYPLTDGRVKVPAAWLIEQAGWKGKSIAGVRVSDQHALVLTNPAGCSARNIMEAAATIQKSVMDEFAIQLNIEPRVYPD